MSTGEYIRDTGVVLLIDPLQSLIALSKLLGLQSGPFFVYQRTCMRQSVIVPLIIPDIAIFFVLNTREVIYVCIHAS